jgi:hypothetical protein
MLRVMRLGRLVFTVWAWRKADKRQKQPTAGGGFIVEWR